MNKNAKDMLNDAEEYALFGHPDTTMLDCDFLEDIIKISGCSTPELLDIACGLGRHALEMTRRGYSVTGIDISENMICSARENSIAEGFDIQFEQYDMREMEFSEQFDFAYILFNTLGLLTSNGEILDFLYGVHDALRSNGLFVFQVGNIWSYIAEGNFSNSVYESEQEIEGIKRKLVMQMVIGPYNNIYRMHYEKQYWRHGKKLEPISEDVILRIFSLNELDLLLEQSGFHILEVFGATELSAVIDAPNQIFVQKEPFHSFVVLAMKKVFEVNYESESVSRPRRWSTRRSWLGKSHNRYHTRSGMSIRISQRGYSMGNRHTGWRRRRN